MLLASIIYFIYQAQVLLFDDTFSMNVLYLYGDFFYVANALFYILASMRDCGVFRRVSEYKFLYICQPVGEDRQLADLKAMRENALRRRREDGTSRQNASSDASWRRDNNGADVEMQHFIVSAPVPE